MTAKAQAQVFYINVLEILTTAQHLLCLLASTLISQTLFEAFQPKTKDIV